jgi:hypothetical protein
MRPKGFVPRLIFPPGTLDFKGYLRGNSLDQQRTD